MRLPTARSTWVLGAATMIAASACRAILGIDPDELPSSDAGSPGDAPADVASTEDANEPKPGDDAGTHPKSYAEEVLLDEPLIYLRLGETGGTSAKEEMHAADGTYSATGISLGTPGAIAGDPNTAITLAGGTARITMPPGETDFEGMAPFTAELWFRARAKPVNTFWGMLIDHQSWSPSRHGWSLRAGHDTVSFERAKDLATVSSVYADPGPPAELWHHLVAVFDGEYQQLFIDGESRWNTKTTMALPHVGVSYPIGNKNCCDDDSAFVGDLDEVAIYAKALAFGRIRAHYAWAKKP